METATKTRLEVIEGGGGTSPGSRLRRIARALVREVRSRPKAYALMAVFVLAGPIVATLIFPEAPPAAAVVGGLIFGVYAALCAVPQKFL